MPDPLVLGFDTSASHCGAALFSGGRCLATRHENMVKGQAERLFPMLMEILDEAGFNWRDLNAVGVGVGPGNFTGIRISVSAARGLALGLGIPAFGVTLLEAAAHDVERPVLACLDAHRGTGYFQRHGFGDPKPFIAPLDDLNGTFRPGLRCVGNLGEEMAIRLGVGCQNKQSPPAYAVARIAIERQCAGWQAGRPTPFYLRAPDASPPTQQSPKLLT